MFTLLALLLLALELIYIPAARAMSMRAPVTPRSSHTVGHVTGGGFIFFIAALVLTLCRYGQTTAFGGYTAMMGGAAVLFAVSLADDYSELSPVFRLVVQTVVVGAVFFKVAADGYWDIWLLILVCGVGFINGFNFMDGINGMLAAYSAVTLSTMVLLYHMCRWRWGADVPEMLSVAELVATLVFALFNFRRRAVCFSGDVGSIVTGFFIVWLTVSYVVLTADASIVVFLSVYGVDVVFTLFQRLLRGDNILTSHRLHLYQLLANEMRVPHLRIASGYAAVQAAVNAGWFMLPAAARWPYTFAVVAALSVVYLFAKHRLTRRLTDKV